jgi:hypothetical protein
MSFAKLLQGIVVGALFSGILSAICAVYITLTSDTSDSFGLKAKDFWWLAMLYAGFFGLIVGGILGGIVSALNLSLITAGLCGLIITIIPAIFFRLLSEGKFDENFIRFGIFFIAIATLTGIFVSFAQTSLFKSE